jgi:hypothetical protein
VVEAVALGLILMVLLEVQVAVRGLMLYQLILAEQGQQVKVMLVEILVQVMILFVLGVEAEEQALLELLGVLDNPVMVVLDQVLRLQDHL